MKKVRVVGRNLPGIRPVDENSGAGKRKSPDGQPVPSPRGEEGRRRAYPLEELEVEVDVPPRSEAKDWTVGSQLKPAAALVDGFEYRFRGPEGTSNPVFINFAGAPVISEKEPNDKPANAQALSLPCELVGQFFPA